MDVLGFSDVVCKNSPSDLPGIVNQLRNSTIMSIGYFPPNEISRDRTGLDVTMLSDTIAIWTFDDSAESLQHLILAITGLMSFAFKMGLPLRGAISFGAVVVLPPEQFTPSIFWNKMVFGRAVIEAHKVEKAQCWSGCIITQSALEHYSEINTNPQNSIEKLLAAKRLLQYPVKCKKGIVDSIVVNWACPFFDFDIGGGRFGSDLPDRDIRNAFECHGKSLQKSNAAEILQNTIDFIHYVKKLYPDAIYPD